MNSMQMSKEGYAELMSYEGLTLTPCLDIVGVKTIGIGLTASDIPDLKAWPWNKEMTLNQAVCSYLEFAQKYVDAVNNALHVVIAQHQFDALCSICYNIGIGGMRGSSFMRDINNGASLQTIGNAIMQWNKPAAIIGRRTKEKTLYMNGTYSNKGMILQRDVDPRTHKERGGKDISIIDCLNSICINNP